MESLGFLILKTGIRLSCPHRYIGANRNPPVLSSVHIVSLHSLPPSPKSPMPVGLRPADGRFKDVLRGQRPGAVEEEERHPAAIPEHIRLPVHALPNNLRLIYDYSIHALHLPDASLTCS